MPLIVIEGIDGCGGETHSDFLKEWLAKKRVKNIKIESPDDSTPVGQAYGKYLHEKFNMEADAIFLLCACDVIMNKSLIENARKEGVFVIADRYITSTIAYQGANGFLFDKALKLVDLMEFPKADAILYIDISPDISMKRKQKEKDSLDKHEKNKQFLAKVREFYKKEIDNSVLGEWFVIDGERSIEEIQEDITRLLSKKFGIK